MLFAVRFLPVLSFAVRDALGPELVRDVDQADNRSDVHHHRGIWLVHCCGYLMCYGNECEAGGGLSWSGEKLGF